MSGKGRAPKGNARRKQRKVSAVQLQAEGKSERSIAAILGISKSESHRLLAEANAEARPDQELIKARRDRLRNVLDEQLAAWAPKSKRGNARAGELVAKFVDRLDRLDGVSVAKTDHEIPGPMTVPTTVNVINEAPKPEDVARLVAAAFGGRVMNSNGSGAADTSASGAGGVPEKPAGG